MGRQARHGLRDKWRLVVLGCDELPDAGKVTLLAMSLSMTDQGYVSTPRDRLAEMVGKHPRKVTAHVALAVDLGLLQKVGGGYSGRSAEYAAVLPHGKVAASGVPIGGKGGGLAATLNGHLHSGQIGQKVAASGVPNTRASEDVPRQPDVSERPVRVVRLADIPAEHRDRYRFTRRNA